MRVRKRMSLGGLMSKASRDQGPGHENNEPKRSSRRSSLSAWVGSGAGKKLGWATGVVQRSLSAAATAVDKATKDFFLDFDDDDDSSDDFGAMYAQRGQTQRAEFEARYRHLVETLGDLSLTADVDPEGAAAELRKSGVREDVDSMLALLKAEERRNTRAEQARNSVRDSSNGGSGASNDTLAAPCLEFLLEERVVKLLCELGATDRPAGTMSLVMGGLASLLGQVGHPLLPSQAVHDPIIKLLAAAGDYGRRRGLGREVDRRLSSNSDCASPEDRVTANLARLLGAIWRKLREESALLDFFFRSEESSDADASAAAATLGGTRLDVFERLLPLLDLPGRAGRHAREACLVALGVKDKRVGQFVANRTPLCEQLAQTLTARCLALYDALEDLHAAQEPIGAEEGCGGSPVELEMERRPQHAEAVFEQALSLFVQHLRFCNAVGLVAYDTELYVRYSLGDSRSGISPGKEAAAAERAYGTGAPFAEELSGDDSNVAAALASRVREVLLGEAIGPALASALDSRAGFAQAIAARTVAELSAGVEMYGVAVAGIGTRAAEGGRCRRQLGPLLDAVAAFLVGRERCRYDPEQPAPRADGASAAAEDAAAERVAIRAPGSMVVINSTSGACISLRDVLLRRIASASPPLRMSTLELIASLAELRNERVLLDLALRPEIAAAVTGSVAATPTASAASDGGGLVDDSTGHAGCKGSSQTSTRAARLQDLLSVSGLEGLKVSPDMVRSFGLAFSGSPIHPTFRLLSASQESLEGYLVEAHQRQIQQLMDAAGGFEPSGLDDEAAPAETAERGQINNVVTSAVDVPAELSTKPSGETRVEEALTAETQAATTPEFDAGAFVREHGKTLALAADVQGSFVCALFDCLEVIFERTLEENVAVTGVLSSLCLAATATEISPVRRLLLVLLFDGTPGAPFRSMRRILERLWAAAQERLSRLPSSSRRLAEVRASLGMATAAANAADATAAPAEPAVADERASAVPGGQGSRGMREELRMSRQQAKLTEADGAAGKGSVQFSQQQEQQQHQESHFLETYVFLEEFLKEVYCALSARSHVLSDARDVHAQHREGSEALSRRRGRGCSVDEAEASPRSARARGSNFRWSDASEGDVRTGGDRASPELPMSLDDFLREAALPTLVTPPVMYCA